MSYDRDLDGRMSDRWMIDLAKDGDGSVLAELFRDPETAKAPLSRELLKFLAGVFSGEIKLKRRKKLTAARRSLRPERGVWMSVRGQMGNRRDKAERYRLIEKYCKIFGTTVEAYRRYEKHAGRK